MSESILCPWCEAEIIWDEELGSEKTCPHCLNELGDYRSIEFNFERDEQNDAALAAGVNSGKTAGENHRQEEKNQADESEIKGFVDVLQEDPELLAYEEAVENFLVKQDETPECGQCREYMVFAGEHTVPVGHFTPFTPQGSRRGFLEAPFTLNMYLCPACFHTTFALNEQSRMQVMESIKK